MRLIKRQNGDTIIEVMLAFTVFSMVAVGALTVMNQGTAGAQNTLETTLVRQQVDNQAEMIRYLHQAYISNPSESATGSMSVKFKNIVAFAKSINLTEPHPYGDICTEALPGEGSPDQRFAVNAIGQMLPESEVKPVRDINAGSSPYAQLYIDPVTGTATSYGLWVEPVISNAGTSTQYIDFNIRACWQGSVGSNQRTIGTIVRLYVPENIATGTGGATPTTPPPIVTVPVSEYTVNGDSYTRCFPHRTLEGSDAANPAFPVFNPTSINTTDATFACQKVASENSAYNCSNYDTEYGTGLPSSASAFENYEMIINYSDMDCGNGPLAPPYTFKVAVYKDGTLLTETDLNMLSTSRSVNVGPINKDTKIQLRWWNNHATPGGDPDFKVESLRFRSQP